MPCRRGQARRQPHVGEEVERPGRHMVAFTNAALGLLEETLLRAD